MIEGLSKPVRVFILSIRASTYASWALFWSKRKSLGRWTKAEASSCRERMLITATVIVLFAVRDECRR